MAVRRFDELNAIGAEIDNLNVRKRIRDYFEEMEISRAEKNNRIGLAILLFGIFYSVFEKISTIAFEDEITDALITQFELEVKNDYINAMAECGYDDLINDDKLNAEADKSIRQILRTTADNYTVEYFKSADRAIITAQDETNCVGNYSEQMKAIKAGKKFKKWLTQKDDKVRHTHKLVDETVIGIYDVFDVGNSQMGFPMDLTYGPDPAEVVNCRCVCKYL